MSAGDVPPNHARPLAKWLDELGLEELTAQLGDGRLDPWRYDDETATWHRIHRLHLQKPAQVKDAARRGWLIKRDYPPGAGPLFRASHDFCDVFAAPVTKHAGGAPRKYDWEAARKEMERYVGKNGPPKKRSYLERHTQSWFLQQHQEAPSDSLIKAHVKNFLDTNPVIGQASRKPKNT
jgi:hypothetical protein